MNLKGRVALVTGASRGLGFAVSKLLLSFGATVIMCSKNKHSLEKAYDLLAPHYPDATLEAYPVDLTSDTDVAALFKHIETQHKRLDICVTSAGLLQRASIADTSLELWQSTIDANLTSTFLCAKYAFEIMKKTNDRSALVTISSLSGVRFVEKFEGMCAYIASKHAVVGLTEALAVEGKPFNISVNCVAPGSIDTDMFRDNFPEYTPGATPAEIAKVVGFFCDVADPTLKSGTTFEVFCNA